LGAPPKQRIDEIKESTLRNIQKKKTRWERFALAAKLPRSAWCSKIPSKKKIDVKGKPKPTFSAMSRD